MSGRPSALGLGRGGYPDRSRGAQKQIYKPSTPPHLDNRVRKLENETETACKKITGNLSASTNRVQANDHMPLRPGYGTQGRPILLLANYFELMTSPELVLSQHSIDVLADVAGKKPTGKRLQRVVQLLLQEHISPTRNDIATDYKSFLLSRASSIIEDREYRVRYRSEGEDESLSSARSYRVRLKFTRTLQMSELIDYLTSSNPRELFDSKEDMIQALNIVLGHYPKTASSIVSVGANKHFDGAEFVSLGGGLNAVRGLFVSVRAATSRPLVNVQVKHAAFYRQGSLGTLMSEHGTNNALTLGMFLKRLRILVTHIKNSNSGQVIPRVKTINSLASPQDGRDLDHPPIVPRLAAGAKEVMFYLGSPAPTANIQSSTKPKKEGVKAPLGGSAATRDGYISVYDFFRRTHNITIKDPSLPVVNVGSCGRPCYLPADVCTVIAGQPSSTKLSDSQSQRMVNFAVRGPAQNARSIISSGAKMLGLGPPPNATLNAFGVHTIPELITVQGRVLASPPVRYRSGKAGIPNADGSWNMKTIQFTEGGNLGKHKWTYLSLSVQGKQNPLKGKERINAVIRDFQAKLEEVGIAVEAPVTGLEIELMGPNFDAKIDETLKRFVSTENIKLELLLVILPYADTSIYNAIKRGCDIKYGLRHVCVVASKFAKDNNHQYFANVALKVNLKLGGRNQHLDPSKLGIIAEGKTMVVGIDVTHPSPGSAPDTPSVAGIVASVDKWLGQWPADLQVQTARKEMVEGLDGMLKSRLALWAKSNSGSYPQNILIYRDGVSEGQYNLVLENELPLLRKACAETYPADATKHGVPRMSIIIVGKRHHTRFYPTREADADRSSNPHHGTIVDRGVTEARGWDFFLQAHTALLGTARPAHNVVILDEIFRYLRPPPPPFKNAADLLQDLTNNMCYLFGRATKPVSICPPAYYADLVCERARRYLSRLFDASPEASTAGSAAEGAEPASGPDADAVLLHDNVRDTMFYI